MSWRRRLAGGLALCNLIQKSPAKRRRHEEPASSDKNRSFRSAHSHSCRQCRLIRLEQRQKTPVARDCAAKIFGDGLSHVGQRVTDTEVDAALSARAVRHDGHIFARMI